MINAEKIREILKSGKKSILNKTTLGVAALGLTSMLLTGCSEKEESNYVNLDYSTESTLTPAPTEMPKNDAKKETVKKSYNLAPTATPVPTEEVKTDIVDTTDVNANEYTETKIDAVDETINANYKKLIEQGFTKEEIRAMYICMNIDLPVLTDEDDKKLGKKNLKAVKNNLMEFATKVANYETLSPYDKEVSKEGQGLNFDYSMFIINDGSEQKDAEIRMIQAIDAEIKSFQENPTRESFAKVVNILISSNQGGVKYIDANGNEKEGYLSTTVAQVLAYGKCKSLVYYAYNSTNLNNYKECNELINYVNNEFVGNCDFSFAQKDALVTIDKEPYQKIKSSTK